MYTFSAPFPAFHSFNNGACLMGLLFCAFILLNEAVEGFEVAGGLFKHGVYKAYALAHTANLSAKVRSRDFRPDLILLVFVFERGYYSPTRFIILSYSDMARVSICCALFSASTSSSESLSFIFS